MKTSFCFIAFLISVFKLAWPQSEPMRCFDCNSGGSGFGSAICPPNGNLKQEVLTTVRCAERCFSRTIPEKTGVVQRGCSSGLGFFLSRPLPTDGCVKVADNNWWCFCATGLCNIDDMTQYGNGKEPKLVEKKKEESNESTLGPWSREKPATKPTRRTVRTKKPEVVTHRPVRTRKPEVVTDWTRKPKQYEQTTEKLHVVAPVRDYDKSEERYFSRQESVEISRPKKDSDSVDSVDPMEPVGPSYQDPMETWEEERNYETSEESREPKEDDFYRELPYDSHYTQHTHNANGRDPSPNFEIPVFLP